MDYDKLIEELYDGAHPQNKNWKAATAIETLRADLARLMGYEVMEDDYQNKNMEGNKMKMNKVNAPVMGEYVVQNCPNCGAAPCVDVTIKRTENVDSIQYFLSEEVYCPYCGLSGTCVELWNKLRCV